MSASSHSKRDDSTLWEYARANNYTIVSKDSDFHQYSFLYGHPPKVIWLRLGNCSTRSIEQKLRDKADDILAFGSDATAALLVLS